MTGFTAGSFVAVVSTHWNRRIDGKRQIHKVYKNGNFTLLGTDGVPSTKQWRPNHDGTWADEAGNREFRRSQHLEPWSVKIEEEIRQRNDQRRRADRRDRIMKTMERADIPADALHQIETALKFAGLMLEDAQ